MKKSFVELLNEIVNDFKQIHINSKNKNDEYKEIDVFSKISELLRLVKEIENYTTNNLDIIEKIFTLCHTYFGDDIGIIYEKNKDNNDYTKYYRYKYYRIETILQNFIYDNELQIKFYKLDVFEFKSECAHILKNTSSVNKNTQTIKPQLTFKELFQIPYNYDKKQKELKELLKRNGYIDEDNKWVGITKNKNELAFLYHFLNDTPNILQPGKFAPQIKIFYKEFGLTVYNDKEPTKGDCTVKGLKTYSKNNETYNNFKLKFSVWIK